MDIEIRKGKASGVVSAPPSKSYAHRYIIAAALAKGISVIENVELSDDIKATLNCIKSLGASFEILDNKVIINGYSKTLQGEELIFNVNESGSTLRFLIPIALLMNKKTTFIGSNTLIKRGIGIYEEIFKSQNIKYSISDTSIVVEGLLKGGHFEIVGNISSQFITGLLFTLPLLESDSIIEIIPPVESKNYIDMTIETLDYFGIRVTRSKNIISISGGQSYNPYNAYVEADFSNAAFLDAFNLIGGNVEIDNLDLNSIQGDKIYLEYFKKLDEECPTIDISNCVDLGPVLMMVAAVKNGATIKGTARLKIKESSRADAMKEELTKFGAKIDVFENEVIIHNTKLHKPTSVVDTHNDHRIAMSLVVLLSMFGGTMSNSLAVKKSFPSFFEVIKKLGIEVL